jgi:hypothetical protein
MRFQRIERPSTSDEVTRAPKPADRALTSTPSYYGTCTKARSAHFEARKQRQMRFLSPALLQQQQVQQVQENQLRHAVRARSARSGGGPGGRPGGR